MLKIKLLPLGKKRAIKFRIVVAEENSKLTSAPVDLLGIYHSRPVQLKLDAPKLEEWLKKGAQLTPGMRRILAK